MKPWDFKERERNWVISLALLGYNAPFLFGKKIDIDVLEFYKKLPRDVKGVYLLVKDVKGVYLNQTLTTNIN